MNLFLVFGFILFAFAGNLITVINSGKCGAGLIKMDVTELPSSPQNRKARSVRTQRPILIKIEKIIVPDNSVSQIIIEKVEEILKNTIAVFQKLLIIQPIDINIQIGDKLCEKPMTEIINIGTDADVIIFPQFSKELPSNVVAAAALCNIANDGRPVAGALHINANMIGGSLPINIDPYYKMLFLHELTHVLVFNPQLFPKFKNPDPAKPLYPKITTLVNGISKTKIATPKVIEAARKHFNCPTLDGVEIEDQGGEGSAGSHWESRIMLGDYMISSDYAENVISDITLALFEDSGWYTVNKYTGGLFRFGKNQGCSFLSQPCIKDTIPLSNNEFCNVSGQNRCFAGRSGKGICYLTEGLSIPSHFQYYKEKTKGGYEPADFCPISFINNDKTYYYHTSCKFGKINSSLQSLGETIGEDSICMISSLKNEANLNVNISLQPMCYKVSCDNKKLTVTINGSTITCPIEGGVIDSPSGFTGQLYCPDYNLICSGSVFCTDPIDCVNQNSILKTDSDLLQYIPQASQIPAVKQPDEVSPNSVEKSGSYASLSIFLSVIVILLFL